MLQFNDDTRLYFEPNSGSKRICESYDVSDVVINKYEVSIVEQRLTGLRISDSTGKFYGKVKDYAFNR